VQNKLVKMKKINKNRGFTLVELLVVISIIAILSSVLATGYVTSQKNARDAARKLNLKSIADALNMYYNDYGTYPGSIAFGSEFKDANGTVYMVKVPSESTTDGLVQIQYQAGSKSFKLFTNLENNEDKACVPGGCTGYTISRGCCYAVTSSNILVNTTPLP
jgi:prepilin-type N-terminal cleavage/methylation domain-containing protein